MAFNGSGTFTRIYNWVIDKANSIPITASRMDGELDGIAAGLSNCITKDGQTTITANIPFANYKITGLGNGTTRSDAINAGQVQDNQFLYLGTTGGSADAYTLSPAPAITAYATTQQFTAKINATNTTTTPYLQISGIANPTTTAIIKKLSATKTEIAVAIGDLVENGIYTFQRNSANNAWIVLELSNPATTTTQGMAFLSNPITIANNATDANNDIDFSAGNALLNDGSGQLILLSAITKRLDASWSAGTNNGGLFSGTKANSTWYYAFAILNTSTGAVDAGFDSSSSGANVPSGWKISKLINCFKTSGAGNILTGTYFKDSSFYYTSQLLEESASNANNAGNLVLSFVPPIPAYAINSAYANNNTVNAYAYYTAGTSSTNIIWETSKLNAGFGRANGFIPTNNATIYRTYGRDAGQSSVCELYTCGFKLINS